MFVASNEGPAMNTAFPTNAHARQAGAHPASAAATGSVAVLLRAEALIEFALAVSVYRHTGGPWPIFALLFLVPDVTMLAYLANPRIGARVYNLGHTMIAPSLLALAGLMMATPLLVSLALIWAAHIGFDRFMGYGLKYPAAFGATHLS
jgi:hypothetical protein